MDFGKLTEGPKGSFLIADMVFSVLAVLLCCVLLYAISKTRLDLAGYRCFLISYIISDLFTGAIDLLRFFYVAVRYLTGVTFFILPCGGSFIRSLQLTGLCANLLSLSALSADHFCGVVYPSRYGKIVTGRVTGAAIFVIWIFSFIFGFIDAPFAASVYLTRNLHAGLTMDMEFSFPLKKSPVFLPTLPTRDQNAILSFVDSLKQPLISHEIHDSSDDNNRAAVFNFFLRSPAKRNISNFDLNAFRKTNHEFLSNVQNYLFVEVQRIVHFRPIEHDWCSLYMSTRSIVEFLLMGLTLICFTFIFFCYGRILKQVLDNTDHSLRNRVNEVLNTCFLLGAFIILRIPFLAFEFTMTLFNDPTVTIPVPMSGIFFSVHNVLDTLFISYPFVDVVICITRIRAVRKFIVDKYLVPACCKSLIRRYFYAGGQTLSMRISTINGGDRAFPHPSASSSHALITPSHSSVEPWYHNNSKMSTNSYSSGGGGSRRRNGERHSSSNNNSSSDCESQIIAVVTTPRTTTAVDNNRTTTTASNNEEHQ